MTETITVSYEVKTEDGTKTKVILSQTTKEKLNSNYFQFITFNKLMQTFRSFKNAITYTSISPHSGRGGLWHKRNVHLEKSYGQRRDDKPGCH